MQDELAIVEEYKSLYPNLQQIGRGNPVVKEIRDINNNTKPNPKRLFVMEGIWGVDFVLKYDIAIEYMVVCPAALSSPSARSLFDKLYARCQKGYLVSEKVFEAMREKDNSAGLFCVCRFPQMTLADLKLKDNMVVAVLDGLEIQGNVGTIARSCDAAGVDAIVLTNRRIRLTHPKLIKSSMGACLKIPMIACEVEEAMEYFHRNGFTTYLTDTDATDTYYTCDYSGRVAIVAGSERYGISRPWYESENRHIIKIPMLGDCDSLNVGISTTIILYEAALRQRGMLLRGYGEQ